MVCVLIAFLLAACSRPAAPPPVVSPPAEAPPEPPKPVDAPSGAAGVTAAGNLLPSDGTWLQYHLSDETQSLEYYVRDGNRVLGSYNGKPYVTWFVTPEGVWRKDPQGPALLRYLPPELKDGLVWRQQSGSDYVWFRLRESGKCAVRNCWELTVLNRMERTTLLFAQGQGVERARSDNMVNPAASYDKLQTQINQKPEAAPIRQALLAGGDRLPEGSLPKVAEASDSDFAVAMKGQTTAITEIDLDGDGRKEWIEGKLDGWVSSPITVLDDDGTVVYGFAIGSERTPGAEHRLQLVRLAGIERPTLVYEHHFGPAYAQGRDTWHRIALRWMGRKELRGAWGWHPKVDEVIGSAWRLEPDGTVTIEANPKDLAGNTWTRRFRVTAASEGNYRAALAAETLTPDPYPTTSANLLTAAFLARWFGRETDLERYMPDPAVREAFKAGERSPYVPQRVLLGRLSWKQEASWPEPVPEIEPDPAGTDFLMRMGQYEGFNYVAGTVAFEREPDGRLVIRKLTVTRTGYVY